MSKINYTPEVIDLRERTLHEYYSAIKRNEHTPHAIGVSMKDGWTAVAADLTYELGHTDTAMDILETGMKIQYGPHYDLSKAAALRENIVDVTCNEQGTDAAPVIRINGILETEPPSPF